MGTVKVWDNATYTCRKTLTAISQSKIYAAGSLSDVLFATGSDDNTIKIWNGQTYHCLNTLTEHKRLVFSIAAWKDTQRFVSQSDDGTIKIWKTEDDNSCLKTIEHGSTYISTLVLWPDKIISENDNKQICAWDPETGALRFTLKGHHTQQGVVRANMRAFARLSEHKLSDG